MNFSTEQEASESNFSKKEVYLGKCLYKIVAVNPNKEQLKAIGQFVPEDEPSYISTQEINGKECRLANITIYLQSPNDNSIVDRVTYSIIDNVQESSTGKIAVINKYGNDAWLEPGDVTNKTLPSSMDWYLIDGVKPARRGEKELVRFIRALRNFKKISNKSTLEERNAYVSLFEDSDLEKLFKGDFSDIRSLLMSNPDAKIGFLLGARTTDEGKVYQNMYKEYPMRSFQVGNDKGDEYIVKEVNESQQNGKYASTYFDLSSLAYKKYDPNMAAQPSEISGNDGSGHDDLPF